MRVSWTRAQMPVGGGERGRGAGLRDECKRTLQPEKDSFVLTLSIEPQPINTRISLILRLQRENQGIPSHRSRPKSSCALRKLRRCGRMLRGETVGWCSNKGRIDAGGVNAEALRRGRWLVPRERIILARVKRLRVRGIVRSRLTFDVQGWGHDIHPRKSHSSHLPKERAFATPSHPLGQRESREGEVD